MNILETIFMLGYENNTSEMVVRWLSMRDMKNVIITNLVDRFFDCVSRSVLVLQKYTSAYVPLWTTLRRLNQGISGPNMR